jgi:CDP-diacylglycerol--glycerol-3-phosphate 3-phosphatidyltransferase
VARRGGTANQVTLLALAGSCAVGATLAVLGSWVSAVWLLLPAWMLCRMGLNALDGLLAREHGQASRVGAYLNELADVASDAALILPFATLSAFWPSLVVLITLLAAWSELAGVLGPTVGASRRFEGPMGKADRAAVFGLLGAWIGWTGQAPPLALLLQLGLVALLGITVLRRVGHGLDEAAGVAL